MKSVALLAAVILPLYAHAEPPSLEDISPHLSPNARIIWKASTNDFPKTLWTYQKQPQRFSPTAVSNALTLGGFELKPFPKTLTKPITIWDRQIESDPQPDYFAVDPNLGSLSFRRERRPVSQGDDHPAALVSRTWHYAEQIELDKTLLVQSGSDDPSTVSLARKIDGIAFRENMEGFSLQYGPQGAIRSLSLNWPTLKRVKQERVASSDEIMRCIRAFKTPVLPAKDETNYFERIKTYANAQTLIVTHITPYYSEGKYGEQPSDTEPVTFVGPVAVLDAMVDWGGSNAPVKLFSPLLQVDANRQLAQKKAK